MPVYSMKSTKQELLDALNEAQAQLKKRGELIQSVGEQAKKEAKAEVQKQAAADVQSGIFSDALMQKYNNLVQAIADLESRLTELYGIETTLLDTTTMINAKKEAQIQLEETYSARESQLEQEYKDRKAQLEQQFNERKEAIQKEQAELKAAVDQQKKDVAVERKREEENFTYNLQRTRRLDADQYKDQQDAAQKVIEEEKARAAEIRSALEARQAEIAEMEKKLEKLPTDLQAKFEEGVEAGKKEAGKEFGYQNNMAKKEHEHAVEKLEMQISMLEKSLAEKSEQIKELERKLDDAYKRNTELSMTTAQATGSVRILQAGEQMKSK